METPHVGYSGSDVAKYVTNGYRLEVPGCDDRIYMLMRHCWKTTPESRLTFTELNEELKAVMKEIPPEISISLRIRSFGNSSQSGSTAANHIATSIERLSSELNQLAVDMNQFEVEIKASASKKDHRHISTKPISSPAVRTAENSAVPAPSFFNGKNLSCV